MNGQAAAPAQSAGQKLMSMGLVDAGLLIACIYTLLSPILSLLIMSRFTFVGHFVKLVDPLILFMCGAWLLAWGRARLDLFAGLMALSFAVALAAGLFHGPDPRAMLSHVFVGLFIFTLYTTYANSDLTVERLEQVFGVMAVMLTPLYGIAIVFFWILYWQGHVFYPGFSCEPLLFPLAYYLLRRRYVMTVIVAVLIVASGKRGVYLGAFAVAALYFAMPYFTRFSRLIALSALASLLMAAATVYLSSSTPLANVPVVKSLASKMSALNMLDEKFNLTAASSGRSEEIINVWRAFSRRVSHYVVGMGYGWTYQWTNPAQTHTFTSHYVHFSILNFLLIYGLALGGGLLVCLWFVLDRSYAWISEGQTYPPGAFLFLVLMGKLIVAQTGYSMASDPLLWILFGALGGELVRRGGWSFPVSWRARAASAS